MSMSKSDVQRWLNTITETSSIWIDEGGLALNTDDDGAYLEIGGEDDHGDLNLIPDDFPVKAISEYDSAKVRATCGTCGRTWDDGVITSMTPAPSGRCPFEAFHDL